MLVEFKVGNYFSIKDEVCLSLESSSSTSRLKQNCFTEGGTELLKSIAVYGANATGKSNLIRAVWFMWAMVLNSQNHKFGQGINVNPYKLDKSTIEKPSTFEMTFILDSVKYVYGFSCTKDKVIEEYLLAISGPGRPRELFIRKNTNEFKFTTDVARQNRIKEETNENQLYLSKIALQNYEPLKKIYLFFSKTLYIGGINPQWSNYTREKMHKDPKFKKWVLSILNKADFGGIKDIELEEKEGIVRGFEFKIGETPSAKMVEGKKETFLDLKFVHQNNKKENILFEEKEESSGTIKTLNILGPIYDILKNGMIVFIDEFEIHLHPEISRFLVSLFHSEHNEKNGQIIFTTHDTTLLRPENLFRRDQIYLTEKDPNKHTVLHSLMDYKLREDVDFQKAYLNGRVGGLPIIDESFI